ncbi:MAG: AAA family ATPase, partial [Chlamydiae bacterium]|nr:AAA family ATPase [Chlamydiota bacterium]
IRRFGWTTAAMLTPIVLLITSIAFFSFILFRDPIGPSILFFGTSPLMLAVIFGSVQNIISKSAKYSLFDPTKEMAYIPLDDEYKVKGKAAIEIVGSRFGKSGGAFIQQGLLLIFGTIDAIAPFVAIIMIIVILFWMVAARSLGRQFASRTREEVYEH